MKYKYLQGSSRDNDSSPIRKRLPVLHPSYDMPTRIISLFCLNNTFHTGLPADIHYLFFGNYILNWQNGKYRIYTNECSKKSIYDFSSIQHISINDKGLFFAFLSILPSIFMFVLKEMHLWFLYLSPLKDLILLDEILHAWPSPWGQSNKWNCQVAFFNKHMRPCKYLRTV